METNIPDTRQNFIFKKLENKNELWKMKSLVEGL